MRIVEVMLGYDGTQRWIDYGEDFSALNQRFYRVRRVPGTAPEDEDSDGIDGWYELQHDFLDPLNGADAAVDHDGDGASNLAEYNRHTDPGDTAEVNVTLFTDPVLGDDSHNGLRPVPEGPNGPIRNIHAAVDVALSGDAIEMAAGTYPGDVVVTKDLVFIPRGSVVVVSDI